MYNKGGFETRRQRRRRSAQSGTSFRSRQDDKCKSLNLQPAVTVIATVPVGRIGQPGPASQFWGTEKECPVPGCDAFIIPKGIQVFGANMETYGNCQNGHGVVAQFEALSCEMTCYTCGGRYPDNRWRLKEWAESGRWYDPTDWSCPRCERNIRLFAEQLADLA